MISWGKLTYCLAAISKLPNGGGAEIGFSLDGKSYMLIHYRDRVTLTYYPDDFETSGRCTERTYSSIEEAETAQDFGFCLKDEWKNVTELICNPDFDEYPLDVILEDYRKCSERSGKR